MEKKYFLELNRFNDELNRFKVHYDSICVVCNKKTPHMLIGHIAEHEYSYTTSLIFPVYRCSNCQLTYLHPRPDVSELKTIYPPDYYTYNLSLNQHESDLHKKSLFKSILVSLDINSYRQRILPFINKEIARPL